MINYIIKNPSKPHNSQSKRYGVVKLTQDVHAHFHVSCLQEEGQQPKAPKKRTPAEHLKWVKTLVSISEKVYSCYEAGPTGFALHRQLTALGVENIVVAPVRLDEKGKRVNNDNTDTLTLAGRLDRYVAGNKKQFTVIRVPTEEQEQRRVWPRQYKQLAGQRLSLASQARSLVLTQGISITNNWWRPALWKKHLETLPAHLIEHLEIFKRVILSMNQEMAGIQAKIVAGRKEKTEPKPKYAGDKTMETIESEVLDWTRFTSWRKVGSYTGLTGGVSSSGAYHADLSITKVGNRRLRSALIEMAWRFVRYQPDYWLTKKWAHILGPLSKAHRRLRKKAIVAFARQLMIDLWKWKTGRATPEQMGWAMC